MATAQSDPLAARFPGLFYHAPIIQLPVAPPVVMPPPNMTPTLTQVIAACLESWGMVGNTMAAALDIQTVIKQYTTRTATPATPMAPATPVGPARPLVHGSPSAPPAPPSAKSTKIMENC